MSNTAIVVGVFHYLNIFRFSWLCENWPIHYEEGPCVLKPLCRIPRLIPWWHPALVNASIWGKLSAGRAWRSAYRFICHPDECICVVSMLITCLPAQNKPEFVIFVNTYNCRWFPRKADSFKLFSCRAFLSACKKGFRESTTPSCTKIKAVLLFL